MPAAARPRQQRRQKLLGDPHARARRRAPATRRAPTASSPPRITSSSHAGARRAARQRLGAARWLDRGCRLRGCAPGAAVRRGRGGASASSCSSAAVALDRRAAPAPAAVTALGAEQRRAHELAARRSRERHRPPVGDDREGRSRVALELAEDIHGCPPETATRAPTHRSAARCAARPVASTIAQPSPSRAGARRYSATGQAIEPRVARERAGARGQRAAHRRVRRAGG